MTVWQELGRLSESYTEDYDSWDVEDLQAELTDLESWLDEVSGDAARIFYGSEFSKKEAEYRDLCDEEKEYAQKRAAVLDALAKKGNTFLGAKSVSTNFLGHEVPDTQAREYLTKDGLLTSLNMNSSAHDRPDWFTSQMEIDNAIKKFKCSGYHTRAGYDRGTDTFKTFTRDSFKQEQEFYKKPSGPVAMRIHKRGTYGDRSIPSTGTVYLTDDPALPISETPFWFKDSNAAQDLWYRVKCERLTNLYELEPIYKFLADKYNWQFPNNAEKQDAIKWLRANGIIVQTPEEEARDLEAARIRLDADLAEIKRINAIKDPVEREAAAKAFRERRSKR